MLQKIGNETVGRVAYYKSDVQTWYAESSNKGIPQSVKGFDFRISSGAAPTLNISTTIYFEYLWDGTKVPDANGGDLYKIVLQKLFKEYGFRETETSIGQKTNQPRSYTTTQDAPNHLPDDITVARGDVSCTLKAGTYSLDVTCDSPDIQKYLAGRMQPFAQSYSKGNQTWIKDIVAGPLVIKSEKNTNNQPITGSETSGYDIAEMVVQMGDKRRVALFYANYNKSSQWHYVTEATDEFGFPCTDIMKNTEARKALYDQICYDNNQGQIRVDSDRRALQ